MSLRQAFSKWLRNSSDRERDENPEIVEALGEHKATKQTKKQKEARQREERKQESRSGGQSTSPAGRVRGPLPSQATESGKGSVPKTDPAPQPRAVGARGEPRGPEARSQRPTRTATPVSAEPKWHDPGTPTPAFTPAYVPVELPDACDPKSSTVGAHCDIDVGRGAPKAREPLMRSAFGKLGIKVSRPTLRVQVGLDFGTSTTKVMYSVRNRGERKHVPLDLAHGLPGLPRYLIPSLATFDRAGHLLLGHRASKALSGIEWSSGLSNFKMLLARRHEERYLDKWVDARFREHVKKALGTDAHCSPDALTAAYLAYVMLRSRRVLEAELAGDHELNISFNTCVPIDQREHNVVLKAYQRVCGVAERLVDESSEGTGTRWWIDRAMQLLADDATPRAERLFVVPESVAAVSAYTTSLARTDGLHALVDIGAGTTDVSIFRLSQSQSKGLSSEWLSARSIPIGTAHIEQRVADALTRHVGGTTVDRDLVLAAMMGRSDVTSAGDRAIRDGLDEIWNRSAKAWSEAYCKLKRETFWKGPKVRVFLAGGGGLIPAARRIFADSWHPGWGPYPCEILPNPDGWAKPGEDVSFARLCVAYGLCIPVPELESFTMPSETEDLTPTPAVRIDWEQDGDQVTPRPGWT